MLFNNIVDVLFYLWRQSIASGYYPFVCSYSDVFINNIVGDGIFDLKNSELELSESDLSSHYFVIASTVSI